jgi:quercetin dioxygenase-like cupin family protein
MRSFLISVGAATSVLAAAALVPTIALSDEGLEITPVLKTELSGMDGKEANIALVDVAPGFKTERHIHPGHVFVYVLEGEIVIDIEGADPVTVSAGQAIHELPDMPMVGGNASSTDGARFIMFQVGESGKPLMVAQPQ